MSDPYNIKVETFTSNTKFQERLNEIDDVRPEWQAGVDEDGFWFVLVHRVLKKDRKEVS